MREIHIDLSSDNYLQQPKVFGGYVGEHNESKLLVKLPDRMIRDDISYYYFEFQTVLGEHITSPNIYKNTLSTDNEISIALWEQLLTSAGNLSFCINAINIGGNGAVTIKGKTSVCTLCILESPTGEDVLIDLNTSKEELQKSIDNALKEAKDSGEFKGDKGDPGDIENIDQIYTSDSSNAQSGKAVAEAVSTEQNRANTTFANALKGSKSGAAFLISDVSPVTHDMGVKVRSKNLIPYPFIYSTFESNGITFTDNKDGTITLNGQNNGSGISNYNLFQSVDKLSFLKPNTDYYLSCNLDNILRSLRTVKSDGTYNYYTYGNINFSSDETPDRLFIQIKSTNTTTYDNTIVKVQIELGTTATAYTPYVPDLTAVKVKKQGKNLLPPADSGIYYNGSITSGNPFIANSSYGISDFNDIDISKNRGVYAVIKLTEGETYTLTVNNLVNNCATQQIIYAVGFRSSESTIFGTEETDNTAKSSYNPSSFTFTVPKGFPYCLVGLFNYPTVSGDTISFDAMQLELGAEATDYEPYITPTEYTPNADGTVDGVTSLYPNTTLTTDTEGALIDCEYNRDINKAFAEMQSAIISMGGNV